MKKLLTWFRLLTKRLYKKITFLTILLLIPTLVVGYSAATKGDSGLFTVAVAQRGDDPLSTQLIAELGVDSQMLRYIHCESADKAVELVQGGKVDMAWIFEADVTARLEAFLKNPTTRNSVATVVVREDNITLRLAREKLSGTLFRQFSYRLYISYVRENVPALSILTDEELMEYYHTQDITANLFAFDETDPAMANAKKAHYLTAPVRGLLSIVILLSGMATAMYFMHDRQIGTFGWVSTKKMPLVEIGCQLVSLVNVTAVALLTLILTGQNGSFLSELATSLLYCLCCVAFSVVLRRYCRTMRVLATVIPLLVVAMLAICPVFLSIRALHSLQYCFPPTYYINSVYNTGSLLYMAGYTMLCFILYLLPDLIRKNR